MCQLSSVKCSSQLNIIEVVVRRTKKHNCITDGCFKEIERRKRLELETKVEMAGGPGTGLSPCEEDRSFIPVATLRRLLVPAAVDAVQRGVVVELVQLDAAGRRSVDGGAQDGPLRGGDRGGRLRRRLPRQAQGLRPPLRPQADVRQQRQGPRRLQAGD